MTDAAEKYLKARAEADKFDMNDRTLMNHKVLRGLQENLRDSARAYLSSLEKREDFLKAADDYCDASSSDDERNAHEAYLRMLAARSAWKEQP
jgi:hypothetical protein